MFRDPGVFYSAALAAKRRREFARVHFLDVATAMQRP